MNKRPKTEEKSCFTFNRSKSSILINCSNQIGSKVQIDNQPIDTESSCRPTINRTNSLPLNK
jgi:hypothetical protein